MLFKIARVVTSKLIKGDYHFSTVSEVSPAELLERIKTNPRLLLVDTRSTQEFNSGFGHIPNSKLIPLMELFPSFANTDEFKAKVKELEDRFDEVQDFKQQEVITICPGGGLSLIAAEIMAEAGFKDVKSLSGGIDGWFKKGYPTTGP